MRLTFAGSHLAASWQSRAHAFVLSYLRASPAASASCSIGGQCGGAPFVSHSVEPGHLGAPHSATAADVHPHHKGGDLRCAARRSDAEGVRPGAWTEAVVAASPALPARSSETPQTRPTDARRREGLDGGGAGGMHRFSF